MDGVGLYTRGVFANEAASVLVARAAAPIEYELLNTTPAAP
jgi:hypothetical protein